MQNGSDVCMVRVERARRRATTVSHLEWDERVLLAAAEAAEACVPAVVRVQLSCVIADKAGVALHDAQTVGALGLDVAEAEAVASSGLGPQVPAHTISRLTWRLVLDLWGGPDR